MSPVEERAPSEAAKRGYDGAQTRALLRMASDADHDSGESCLTSNARIHEAAGYADDHGRYRSTGRLIERLQGDGVIRPELYVQGVGRMFTVCPLGPWSGTVSEEARRTKVGRSLAAYRERFSLPEAAPSRFLLPGWKRNLETVAAPLTRDRCR